MTTGDVMAKVRAAYERSPLTLHEIGLRMGFHPDAAKQSVWKLLNATTNPKTETLLRYAHALGIEPASLFVAPRQSGQLRTERPNPFTFVG